MGTRLRGVVGLLTAASASIAQGAINGPTSDQDIIASPLWGAIPRVARYPARAERMHIAGRVVLQCRVSSDGGLSNCKTLEETPTGYDFARTALFTADGYRMQEKDAEGRPTRKRWVRITVDFDPPGGAMAFSADQDRISGTFVRWGHQEVMPGYFGAGYPNQARLHMLAGHVVFRCRISETGELKPCEMKSEEPPGWGFDKTAAEVMAKGGHFVKTTAEDGSSTAGKYVELNLITNPRCNAFFMPVIPGAGAIARPPPPGACGR